MSVVVTSSPVDKSSSCAEISQTTRGTTRVDHYLNFGDNLVTLLTRCGHFIANFSGGLLEQFHQFARILLELVCEQLIVGVQILEAYIDPVLAQIEMTLELVSVLVNVITYIILLEEILQFDLKRILFGVVALEGAHVVNFGHGQIASRLLCVCVCVTII